MWMSVMGHHCWINKQRDISADRTTIHVRFCRPRTYNSVVRWLALHVASGGHVKLWDGCYRIEHVLNCNEPRFRLNYWWDTGPDPLSPWEDRPATYLSTWGTGMRPLISNPYAIAQGDRAIRNTMCAPPIPITEDNGTVSCSHRMLRKHEGMFSSDAINQFIDRWIPKCGVTSTSLQVNAGDSSRPLTSDTVVSGGPLNTTMCMCVGTGASTLAECTQKESSRPLTSDTSSGGPTTVSSWRTHEGMGASTSEAPVESVVLTAELGQSSRDLGQLSGGLWPGLL